MPQTQGYLIIEKKNGTDGKPHPVDRTLKLGRGQNCDVRVHVQSVSDEHCTIIVEPGRPVCVRNLSETSPTLLNGVSVGTKKCELQHGDYVSIGERRFRWEYLDSSPFYRLELGNMRRKSDADAIVRRTSQPVAVVLPMIHSRRTIEPSIISQVKRNFARVSAASRLSVPADAEKAPSSSPPPEKVSNDQKSMPEAEGTSSPKRIGQQSDSAVFKTPRKVLEEKTENRKSLRTSVTPQTKQPASTSKQSPISTSAKKVVAGKAQKRKLSITPIPSKRLKIESPKSLDKRKVAALWGIHGKSPAAVRTVTPKKSASSAKKSANSTAKKSAKSALRSTQKSRRPLFSEILKKAVARANAPPKTPGKSKVAVATKKTLFSGVAKKKAVEKQQSLSALTKVLPKLHVQSTGHANSPETFFVGRKLAQDHVSQVVSKSPAEWVKSARKSTAVGDLPKQATPKRKGPLRTAKELLSTSSPVTKSPVKSTKVASPKKSPFFFTARPSPARSATPRLAKRTSLANPLSAKKPVRASLEARCSPGTEKVTTPRTASPKAATPKPVTPKAATPKQETPKGATPKAGTPKPATPKAATPQPATPKSATPKPVTLRAMRSATPRTAKRTSLANPLSAKTPVRASLKARVSPVTKKVTTPKSATPKATTPKPATPKPVTPKPATPKAATPNPSTPRAATRKPATPKAATPKPATPKAATPKPATPKAATSKPATPEAATPKQATPKVTPKVATPKSASPKVVPELLKPSPRVLKRVAESSVKRASLPIPLRINTPRLAKRASLPKSSKPISSKSPEHMAPAMTPQSCTPTSPHKSFVASPNPVVTKEVTPAKTPKAATPKQETPKVTTPQSAAVKPSTPRSTERLPIFASPNPVLEAMKRASASGSPTQLKRISLPSTSNSPNVDVRGPPTDAASAKRARESSPDSLSPEKRKRSAFGDSLVQSLRDRMAKFSPDRSKRFSTASTVVLKSPAKSTSSVTQPVTSTPAPGHRSSILIRGNSGPFNSSPPKSAKSHDSSGRSKNLSVTFSDDLITPGCTPSSSKMASQSATPENEKTSFDFSAVKTPNVPHELYVSSILSSSSKSSNTSMKASGSAKRKTRMTGSRESLTAALCSDRRSSRSPMSPGGYVDVKGIKRLTTAPIKSPTYLAVEGVKRLFGEAKALASDSFTSISGVRELFASPSPSRSRSPEKIIARDSVSSSPVAKIQAQVEERNWNAPRVESPKPAPTQRKKATKARSSDSPVQVVRTTRSTVNPRVRLASPPKEKPKGKKPVPKSPPPVEPESPPKIAKSQAESPAKASPEKSKPAQAKHRRVVSFDLPEDYSSPTTSKRGTDDTVTSSVTKQEEKANSPVAKRGRTTRATAEEKTSPAKEQTRLAAKRGRATRATAEEQTSPVAKRGRAGRAKAEEKTSPAKKQTSRVVKRGRAARAAVGEKTSPAKEHSPPAAKRGRAVRAAVKERTSPAKEHTSPVARRGRATRAAVEEKTSPAKVQTSPVAKRGRPARAAVEEKPSPAKEHTSPVARRGRAARAAAEDRTSPVTKQKRVTRKNILEEKPASLNKKSPTKKDDTVSPVSKRQTRTAEGEAKTSPVAKRTKRAQKAASPAKTTKAKKSSKVLSPKPSPKPSPRKTRQRK